MAKDSIIHNRVDKMTFLETLSLEVSQDVRSADEGGQVPQRCPHHDQQGNLQPTGL